MVQPNIGTISTSISSAIFREFYKKYEKSKYILVNKMKSWEAIKEKVRCPPSPIENASAYQMCILFLRRFSHTSISYIQAFIQDQQKKWACTHRVRGTYWCRNPGKSKKLLVCCSPWGCKESNTAEQLNWTEEVIRLITKGPRSVRQFLRRRSLGPEHTGDFTGVPTPQQMCSTSHISIWSIFKKYSKPSYFCH